MALPKITFKEFASNPITALLFLSLIALSTLYFQNQANLNNQINDLKIEIKELKEQNLKRELENKELQNKIFDILEKLKNI
jgi:regulator of replication initiation timing